MALNNNKNKHALKILRGTSSQDTALSADAIGLTDGQLFYDKRTKKLYVGDDSSNLNHDNKTALLGTTVGLNLTVGEEPTAIVQGTTYGDGRATGKNSCAFGTGTTVTKEGEFAVGKYSKISTAPDANGEGDDGVMFRVGVGTSESAPLDAVQVGKINTTILARAKYPTSDTDVQTLVKFPAHAYIDLNKQDKNYVAVDLNNSDVVGANAIVFSDQSNNDPSNTGRVHEGLVFNRGQNKSTAENDYHYDRLYVDNGDIYLQVNATFESKGESDSGDEAKYDNLYHALLVDNTTGYVKDVNADGVVKITPNTIETPEITISNSKTILHTGVNITNGPQNENIYIGNNTSTVLGKQVTSLVQFTGEAYTDFDDRAVVAIDLKNSDIIGTNSIMFCDDANENSSGSHNNEGLVFPQSGQDNSKYDRLYVNNGELNLEVGATPSSVGNLYHALLVDANGVVKTDNKITLSEDTKSLVMQPGLLYLNKREESYLLRLGNATDGFVIDTSGKIQAQSYNATSDKRLKTNITPYTCEKNILDLPVYEFDYIKTGTHSLGCLAQDLQEICPEIVNEGNDGYLSIEESKIIYLLLQEVKKLKAKVDAINID